MLKFYTIFVLLLFSGSHASVFYSCAWINGPAVDCNIFSPESTCGTNLVTYINKCEFSRAHCADANLNLLHIGNCTDEDRPTSGPSAGGDVVFDFFCTSLSHSSCPTDAFKVCGSDGRTYLNYCEYEKAKCTHRELTIAGYGDCP